jgi:GAF domain-containing protein
MKLTTLFPLTLYREAVHRRRAIGTYATGTLTVLASLLLLILTPSNPSLTDLQRLLAFGFIGAMLVSGVVAVYATRNGWQQAASMLLIAVSFAAPLAVTITGAIDPRAFLVIAFLSISLSGFLIGGRWPLYMMGATIPLFTIAFVNSPVFTTPSWIAIFGIYLPATAVHAFINYLLGQSLPSVAQEEQTQAAERRILLSEASNAVSQRLLAARVDMNVLLGEIVRVVRDTFLDVSHAQIYLIDADRVKASLVASTADNIAPSHKAYGIGSLSLIGRVAISGQAIIVRDTDNTLTGERAYMRGGYLPTTRTEVAIPMRLDQDIIGILDLHSTSPVTLLSEDVRVFETLANQIAVAVNNARLYADAQAQVAENKRLYEQTRANLREIERLNRQLTGAAWTEYLSSTANIPAFTLDLMAGATVDSAEWTPTMAAASRLNQPQIYEQGDTKTVSVPISVRGQVIGAMEFELDPAQAFSHEQLIIVQQAVERLGLTADNTRLFEDTQRTAHREAMVNEISTRIQSMTSVDAVLATATQSLGDAIRAHRIAIRLGHPDEGN